MKVELVDKVAFLEEAKAGAGMPMSLDAKPKVPKMVKKLGKAKAGTGHDCFLKGIRVMMDITATQFEWMQIERYTFLDIVSSQSKMHKLLEMDIRSQISYGVSETAITALEEAMDNYKADGITIDELMCNVPCGLELTARCSASYMSLKTIYNQRKNHKLEGWQGFIKFCDSLPEFNELTGCQNGNR